MIETFRSPLAQALAETLLHFVWQGLLVAFCYAAWLELARFRTAQSRYVSSLVAMLILAICPLITFGFVNSTETSHVSRSANNLGGWGRSEAQPPEQTADDSRWSTPATQGNSDATHASTDQDTSITETLVLPPEQIAKPGPNNLNPLTASSFDWDKLFETAAPYLLLLWLVGVMMGSARLTAGVLNLIWLSGGRLPTEKGILLRSQQLAWRLGLHEARLFASERIREAAVVGFWKPVVLLPTSWLTTLPPSVLESVIAHELAHIRRYDVWVNLLQRVLETLLFYHPAVWWLSHRMRLEREMCCDELAVQATGERSRYALALEQVGRLRATKPYPLVTSFRGDRQMNLLSRVKHVLQVPNTKSGEPGWLVGAIALAIPLALFGMNHFPEAESTAFAQEREGRRAAEEEQERRRSPEAERERRGDFERERETRERREGEERERREVETREQEGDRGRSAAEERREQERRASEARERDERIMAEAMRRFNPQTEREEALFRMVIELRRELEELRREVRGREGGDRERETVRRDGDRERDEEFELPRNWRTTKNGKVFRAYDKNGDENISLEEWMAMTNGNSSDARYRIQKERYEAADPNKDGRFTPAEFIHWYSKGRLGDAERPRRDGEGEREGELIRDREKPRRGDRERDAEEERRERD